MYVGDSQKKCIFLSLASTGCGKSQYPQMIKRECVKLLCLCLSKSSQPALFSLFLVRTSPSVFFSYHAQQRENIMCVWWRRKGKNHVFACYVFLQIKRLATLVPYIPSPSSYYFFSSVCEKGENTVYGVSWWIFFFVFFSLSTRL